MSRSSFLRALSSYGASGRFARGLGAQLPGGLFKSDQRGADSELDSRRPSQFGPASQTPRPAFFIGIRRGDLSAETKNRKKRPFFPNS
jgi:hypothetical protein